MCYYFTIVLCSAESEGFLPFNIPYLVFPIILPLVAAYTFFLNFIYLLHSSNKVFTFIVLNWYLSLKKYTFKKKVAKKNFIRLPWSLSNQVKITKYGITTKKHPIITYSNITFSAALLLVLQLGTQWLVTQTEHFIGQRWLLPWFVIDMYPSSRAGNKEHLFYFKL